MSEHLSHTGDKSDVGVLRLDFPGYSGADTLHAKAEPKAQSKAAPKKSAAKAAHPKTSKAGGKH
jgi:hypothetical protein